MFQPLENRDQALIVFTDIYRPDELGAWAAQVFVEQGASGLWVHSVEIKGGIKHIEVSGTAEGEYLLRQLYLHPYMEGVQRLLDLDEAECVIEMKENDAKRYAEGSISREAVQNFAYWNIARADQAREGALNLLSTVTLDLPQPTFAGVRPILKRAAMDTLRLERDRKKFISR